MASAIQKNLMILQALAEQGSAMTIAELSHALTMPKQTIHRVVTELERLGALSRDIATDGFMFGPIMRNLATDVLHNPTLSHLTHPILLGLVNEVKETCNIGILTGHEVTYVDRQECEWPLRVQLQPGSKVPVHCTAIGKLLLAYLKPTDQQKLLTTLPLTPFTDTTITDSQRLEVHLQEIRNVGHAFNNEEDCPGLIAMAVPILDTNQRVRAGLAIHAPTSRMTVGQLLQTRPLLDQCAQSLSAALFGDGTLTSSAH